MTSTTSPMAATEASAAPASQRFFRHFVRQMGASGLTPAEAARHLWRPCDYDAVAASTESRHTMLSRLALGADELASQMDAPTVIPARVDPPRPAPALLLLPGFTHETLRHRSWHEVVDDTDSPHHLVHLTPGDHGACSERHRGRADGLPIAYVGYPRSNAHARIIVPGIAQLLRESASVQQWCREGRQLILVGYSNGAPLALELLARLNRGELDAGAVRESMAAMVSLCGDIQGSYLADDVMSAHPRFLSMTTVVAFAERYPLLARLIGLGTPQLRADMLDGVRSLGHAERQAALAEWSTDLPADLQYLSIAAVLPLADYRRHWWQFNLDDLAMYRQARVTDPITPLNDGQVAWGDARLPELPHVPASRKHDLGVVRAHHWAVSYRTFNFGRNRFPRAAFNRALYATVCELLES